MYFGTNVLNGMNFVLNGSIYVFSGTKEDLTKNRQNLPSPTCFLLSNKLKAET